MFADGYTLTPESKARFYYSDPSQYFPPESRVTKQTVHQPDRSKPVIFRLHKMGLTVPLYRLSKTVRLKDSVRISLEHEPHLTVEGYHFIEVRGAVDLKSKITDAATGKEYYDWSAQIIIPGGGLQRRADNKEWTSPVSGYEEQISITYSAKEPLKWKPGQTEDVFVKFSDATYAQAKVTLQPSETGMLININSLYNPGGGRCLEFDKSKKLRLKTE